MITFLVVNISSLQLIPINMIALPEPVRIDAPAGGGRPGVPGDLYQQPSGRSGGVPRDVQEKAI